MTSRSTHSTSPASTPVYSTAPVQQWYADFSSRRTPMMATPYFTQMPHVIIPQAVASPLMDKWPLPSAAMLGSHTLAPPQFCQPATYNPVHLTSSFFTSIPTSSATIIITTSTTSVSTASPAVTTTYVTPSITQPVITSCIAQPIVTSLGQVFPPSAYYHHPSTMSIFPTLPPEAQQFFNLKPQFLPQLQPHIFPPLPMPKYIGRNDHRSPSDFLVELERYAISLNCTPDSLLPTRMSLILEGEAARWWSLYNNITTWQEFQDLFLAEFASLSYKTRLLRDLDRRTQDPEEPLSSYVQTIAEYYRRLGGNFTEQEKVQRVLTQMHPEYRTYTYGRTFESLRELSAEALRIQDAVLQSRLYVRPPAPAHSIEPSLAYRGTAMSYDVNTNLENNSVGANQVSLSALDPLCHRVSTTVNPATTHSETTRVTQDNDGVQRHVPRACFRCHSPSHLVRQCPQLQSSSDNASKNVISPSHR